MQNNNLKKNLKEDAQTIDASYRVAQALVNPFRQKVIGYLMAGQAMSVGQMIERTGTRKKEPVEQSIMSQHLGILREAELVKTRRDGKNIYYTLNRRRYNKVIKLFKQLTAEG